jgi:hypothetical protein
MLRHQEAPEHVQHSAFSEVAHQSVLALCGASSERMLPAEDALTSMGWQQDTSVKLSVQGS